MGKNLLTPEQDLATRAFYEVVVAKANQLPPYTLNRLHVAIMDILNYDCIGGKYVEKLEWEATARSHIYGSQPDSLGGACEWAADKQRNSELFRETLREFTHSTETNSSESSEDTEVREAILPEDV